MGATSRRQKRMQKLEEESVTMDADDKVYKEQKRRLRRQLSSVPAFSVEVNDFEYRDTVPQKRSQVRRQKKLDEMLKEATVLPESEYLNEDTNLRILKKMSVAKQYNNLKLSPDQEEKMEKNKQKFELITNQLWFLIQELEKRQEHEPEMGKVPTIKPTSLHPTLKETNEEKQQRFINEVIELPQKKEESMVEQPTDEPIDFMPPLSDEKNDDLREKQSTEDELEDILHELEAVLHDSKKIAQQEAAQIISQNDSEKDSLGLPEDTLELLDFLEDTEKTKKTKRNADKINPMSQTIDLTNTASWQTEGVQEGTNKTNTRTFMLDEEILPSNLDDTRSAQKERKSLTEQLEVKPLADKNKNDESSIQQHTTQTVLEKEEKQVSGIKKSIFTLLVIFLVVLILTCILILFLLMTDQITVRDIFPFLNTIVFQLFNLYVF